MDARRRNKVRAKTTGKMISSRSDRIMALSRERSVLCDKQQNYTHLLTAASTNETKILQTPSSSSKHSKIEQRVVTDIDKIWQRYVDFNEHSKIFDYNNEYQNSVSIVKSTDIISDLKRVSFQKELFDNVRTKDFLICNETLSCSDKEDINEPTLFEDSDDSVKDKDYIPDSDATDTDIEDLLSPSRKEILMTALDTVNSQNNKNTPIQNHTSSQSDTVSILNEQEHLNLVNSPVSDEKGLTKSGLPRKRRTFDMPLKERNVIKKQCQIEKLSLKNACTESCRQKCSIKFNESQRKLINDSYSKLNKESQGVFIKGMIETKSVDKRKQTNKETPKRKVTYCYFLNNEDQMRTEVCKTFFLTTLGYHPKNDQRVLAALKRPVEQQKDLRGSYERTNKIDRNVIRDHVLSYNPAISHYRREHAPKKLYLPSDINVTLMYENFRTKFPELKVSHESYRTVVKNELNISFTHLGNEECELCTTFKLHSPEHTEILERTCDICNSYIIHKQRYTESRIKYKEDVESAATDKTTIRYSVDLQKVVMLPRIEQFKAAIFCPRIIAFNESFVPLGKTTKEDVPFAIVWNESVSGRHQEDIISTFRAFFVHKRDAENIVLWVDNCASQNKNWAMMSFLVNIVNSPLISAKTIEVRYFEPGHTFMSADHFHHQVEKMMKNRKVYDFDDFTTRVKMANNGKTIVKSMGVSDFFSYEDLSSQYKLRNKEQRIYLKNIMVVKTERGHFCLQYKTGHNEEFKTLDFLQIKIMKTQKFPEIVPKQNPRGVTEERKTEIIQKLVPLMPENRRAFWYNIPVSNSATNLFTEDI